MKIQYFSDTDTLLITFSDGEVDETQELDENTYLDIDSSGKLVSMTIEHAKDHTDINKLMVEGIAA